MEKIYDNLGYFLLLLIPLTFAGFYKTYFAQFPDFDDNIDFYIHLHALIASIWILMLIAQPILIRNKNFKLHRTIGRLSYIVFPLLILSFLPQMIKIVQSGNTNNLFFPLADCLLLILFYSLAIYNRKNRPKHMRYMIGLALVFLGPTIGRIGPILLGWSELVTQNVQYLLIYVILSGLIYYDSTRKYKFDPYLTVLPAFLIHQVVYFIIFT